MGGFAPEITGQSSSIDESNAGAVVVAAGVATGEGTADEGTAGTAEAEGKAVTVTVVWGAAVVPPLPHAASGIAHTASAARRRNAKVVTTG